MSSNHRGTPIEEPMRLPMFLRSVFLGVPQWFQSLLIKKNRAADSNMSGGPEPYELSRREAAVRLADLHFDLLRLGLFALRQRQPQHAILELRVNAFNVDVGRQRERAVELAIAALDAMIAFALVLV